MGGGAVGPLVFGKGKSLLQACVFRIKDVDVRAPAQVDAVFEMIYWLVCWLREHKTARLTLTENLRDSLYPLMRTLSKFCTQVFLDRAAGGAGRLAAKLLAAEIDAAVKLAREEKKRRAKQSSVRKVASLEAKQCERLAEKVLESYEGSCPSEEEVERLREVERELEELVRVTLDQGELVRFGSSANGLAAAGSADLDVALVGYEGATVQAKAKALAVDYIEDSTPACMPHVRVVAALVDDFLGYPAEDIENRGVVEIVVEREISKAYEAVVPKEEPRVEALAVRVIGKSLEEPFHLEEVVDTARVPIVKAVHGPSGTACDIAVGNELAIHNTELLRLYADFDDRVKPLIFAVKRWAKARGLGDASQGSLSSYAWVCLVIFFLQQTKEAQTGSDQKPRKKKASPSASASSEVERATIPILPKLQVLTNDAPRHILKQDYRGKEDVEFDVSYR